MKNIIRGINKTTIVLWILILVYIGYFSFFTILRYQTLNSYYLDLGIMHQAVFNTYRALTNFDLSRVLEITNSLGPDQIKRIAIHNDLILAPLALFYALYASPAVLLVLQAAVLGVGAWFVFKIAQVVLAKSKIRDLLSLIFALSYLLYPPLQKANMFDFHPVTLSTTFLLAMFYFWLKKRYGWSFLFIVLTLLTKEEVGLTIAFFGVYTLFFVPKKERNFPYSLWTIGTSLAWFVLSVFVIIPYFRGGAEHFALNYFQGLNNPAVVFNRLFRSSTWSYLISLWGPVSFLSLLSPLQLLIAAPEYGINLLSSSLSFRNIYFHYTSVITPFVFIAAIYGAKNMFALLSLRAETRSDHMNVAERSNLNKNRVPRRLRFLAMTTGTSLILFSLAFAYFQGPLPFAKNPEVEPFRTPAREVYLARQWAKNLKDENLRISTTGKLAPFFTSRRYFYTFSQYYPQADYVVILPHEVYNYPEDGSLIAPYKKLKDDKKFKLIFQEDNFEVYQKL